MTRLEPALRHRHHRHRRRRRHDGARAGRRPARASWCSSAATSCRRKTRTGTRRRSGRTCATAPPSSGSTATAASSARTRTTASAATPSSGAACSTGCGARTSARCEHADGVSPAWPIDYDTLAPYYDRAERLYHVHGAGRRRSHRAAARPVSVSRRCRTRRAWRRSSSGCAALGLHPSPLPLGLLGPGEAGGCLLCNTCNSFPCRIDAKSDADVLLRAPGARAARTSRCGPARVRDAAGHRSRPGRASRPWRSSAAGERIASRRRSSIVSCGAVNSAALLLRSAQRRAPARPGEFVGPRRPPLHGAPGDDDAGLPSVPEERRRCSRRRWRSTTSTAAARARPIRSGRSSRRAGRTRSWRRSSATRGYKGIEMRHSAVGLRRVGVARRRLAGDDRGSAAARQPRARSTPDGRIRLRLPAEQHAGARAAGRRDCGGSCGGSATGRRRSSRTRPARGTRRTSAARWCSAPIRATSVLDPFCRTHDVENLFVVDASFFPSSAAVNPALTIVAQALRVADHIRAHRSQTLSGGRHESAIVQPRRHHRVGLQPRRAVLLGRVRLPARRRRRHAARARAQLLRRRRARRRRCKIGWIRVPGGGVLEIFAVRAAAAAGARSRGTASA